MSCAYLETSNRTAGTFPWKDQGNEGDNDLYAKNTDAYSETRKQEHRNLRTYRLIFVEKTSKDKDQQQTAFFPYFFKMIHISRAMLQNSLENHKSNDTV